MTNAQCGYSLPPPYRANEHSGLKSANHDGYGSTTSTSITFAQVGGKETYPRLKTFIWVVFGGFAIYVLLIKGLEVHSLDERQRWDDDRLQWRREQMKWDAAQREWQRERKEYERWAAERQPFFGDPVPAERCSAWDRREYTARLWNTEALSGNERISSCYNHTINFQGRTITPERCYDYGIVGGVLASWEAQGDGCRCEFGKFFDKGCIARGSKQRRFESRLWYCPAGEDAKHLCETASQVVQGVFYEKPTFCDDRGNKGMVANWEVPWDSC
ncbi:hypothetical protein PUNSTDRAFT_119535 [Punctularia strigosozonata HHB-11173 SS5]|uniref:uncharacterized protein n=1 Tax=Punctularia strigosozonata (strain HHB-11173) TaxID=741275 RepID=UPI0004417D79|nr:uncharacterized protein PUNSTDRAFT_119535 [Punctularia strigosozonata HHB-11173 SS5]EIN10611.1 hypothetical protein PUNSTDRAFT_119535 [Punctularia strigosozonata HHB-11173 SS5]